MARKKTRNTLTYETLPALFTGICDAIRTKTGGTDPINHQDIPSAITNIPVGSDNLIRYSVEAIATYQSTRTIEVTMEESCNINVLIAQTSAYNPNDNKMGILKNGTEVSYTYSSNASSPYGFREVHNLAVVAGDKIQLRLPPTASLANNVLCIIAKKV